MQYNNNVCRFCFKLVHDEPVELINRDTKNKLAVLLIKLDLDVIEDPLACKMCLGIFDEIYTFKSNCLHSEGIINAHFENSPKVNLMDILRELKNKPDVNIAEDEAICRLCIKIPSKGNYIALNETSEKVSRCRDMMQMQLPEINLNITEEPIICEVCHVLLKNYVSFTTNCMDVERNIKMYCDQKSDVKEQVDLLGVLQFTENKALDCENIFNRDLVVKQEDSSVYVKVEKVDEDNPSTDHFTTGSSTEFYIKEEEVEIKSEDEQKRMEIREFDELHDSNSVRKTDSPEETRRIRKKESEDKTEIYPKRTDRKWHIGSRSHDEVSKCCLCSFTTDSLFALRTHMRSHKGSTNMFGCTECPYETQRSYCLARHVLKHKDRLTLELYKCSFCPYESKSRHTLRQHRKLQHEENIKIYQCRECSWNTKYSGSYVRHQSLHKMDNSSKNPFSCDQCTYSTHAKYNLLRHRCKNRTDPNLLLYCNQCDFCTNWRNALRLHKKTHDPAKYKFKCEQCEYSSYRQSGLKRHLLIHMELEKAVVYYCATCDFKTKRKDNLGKHVKSCLKKDAKNSRVM